MALDFDRAKLPKTPPSSAAERMRLLRRRRRFQRRVLQVEINPAELDALVARGYLAAKERDDVGAIGFAVSALLSDLLVTS